MRRRPLAMMTASAHYQRGARAGDRTPRIDGRGGRGACVGAATAAIGKGAMLPLAAGIAVITMTCLVSAPRAEPVATPPPSQAVSEGRTELISKLEALKAQAAASAAREAALDATVATLERDQRALTEELVRAGERVARLERQALQTEDRLAALTDEEARLEYSLSERHASVATLLAGLQRIGRQPPPAALVRSEDALTAVRGAILLRAALPDLAVESEALKGDLNALGAVRTEIETERRRLETDLAKLADDRLRLEDAIADNRRRRAVSALDLEDERRRTRALAREAATLDALVSKSEAAGRRDAAAVTQDRGDAGGKAPFGALERRLPMPVAGAVLREFGALTEDGTAAEGIVVAAAAGSSVFAPADATVAYAGPFRSYGLLLILDVGDGYHVVMAGLDKLHVDVGQVLVAGEPVGQMGAEQRLSAVTLGVQSARPTLYIEFRKDGAAIDPAPWWAAPFVVSREVGG